jgi:hypothetical protein
MTDPRYDEQFRRGYDGPVVAPPVASVPPAAPPESTAARTSASVTGSDPEPVAIEPVGADRPRDVAAPRPFRRNPFAIGLLCAGILMLVVGVWMVHQSTTLSSIIYTPDQQAVLEIESRLTTPVLVGGVIAIVAWLVTGAFAASADRRGD